MEKQTNVTSKYNKFLWGVVLFSLSCFMLSMYEIGRGNIGGFEPLLFGFGFILFSAFNWADMLIFSLLWCLICVILLKISEPFYFWIVFFSFWFIRGFGETIYSLMQQFHPQIKPWIAYAPRALLQNNITGHFILEKYWVVEQVFFQSITILALFGLVYTVIHMIQKR